MKRTTRTNDIERKVQPFSFLTKEDGVTIEGNTIPGIFAVAGNVDLGNDRIKSGAFIKTIMERLPAKDIKVLWQHDLTMPPIGDPVELKEISRDELPERIRTQHPDATGGLFGRVEYFDDTEHQRSVLSGIKRGVITKNSIGYKAIKSSNDRNGNVRNLHEVMLFDISPVNFPMNPATMNMKSIIPFKETEVAPENETWKTPNLSDFTDAKWEDLDESEKKRIAAHYAYCEDYESFEDLKLPHHKPSKDGVGEVVWNGVKSAMWALVGNMPEEYREDVHSHLAKHYEQFEKEAPELKLLQLSIVTNEMIASGKYDSIKSSLLDIQLLIQNQFSERDIELERRRLELQRKRLELLH